MMVEKKDITGIILAGGKSSRMGTDKGFMIFNEKPFIQYSIDALKPLVSDIMIVSDNSNYDVFGHKRVHDIIKGAGPVSGIYSGLSASKTDYNLVLSCDIPLIKTGILEKLIENIDNDSEIIQIESNDKTMPLIALYNKKCAKVFFDALQNDERRLRRVISSLKTKNVVLNVDNQKTTMNINTQEELKTIGDVHNG
jgi:molybdopterin-guanine dinucleotide biosynthesis protein A